MESTFLKKVCLIGLGEVEGVKEDLTVLSESSVNFVSGDGLIIATFQTAFTIGELEELLKMNGRSFIIFEMTLGFYSASIADKEFQIALFGGEIDNSKTPYNLIEESLKQVKEKIFNGDFSVDKTKKITPKSDEELLNEALKNEDYETAAKLRDLINKKQK
jgi:hypothetical protein